MEDTDTLNKQYRYCPACYAVYVQHFNYNDYLKDYNLNYNYDCLCVNLILLSKKEAELVELLYNKKSK